MESEKKGLKLTEADISKYRIEIDNIDLVEREKVLAESIAKISKMLQSKKMDKYQLVLIQGVNAIYNILRAKPNLEDLVQQKLIFALKYFISGDDEIPDSISEIGYLDDLTVINWIIQDVKEQYSNYFYA